MTMTDKPYECIHCRAKALFAAALCLEDSSSQNAAFLMFSALGFWAAAHKVPKQKMDQLLDAAIAEGAEAAARKAATQR